MFKCRNKKIKMEEISGAKYDELFGVSRSSAEKEITTKKDDTNLNIHTSINKEALFHALDIRKFEIDLYWKRTAYFWAFIVVAFAAYFSVAISEKSDTSLIKSNLLMIISSFGIILSVGWILANKGSKKWQENWENHVDRLEDKITGPLYKTIIGRPKPKKDEFFSIASQFLTGPASYSVSKINQLISICMLEIWGILFFYPSSWFKGLECYSNFSVLITIFTLANILLILFFGRTHEGTHFHKISMRKNHND